MSRDRVWRFLIVFARLVSALDGSDKHEVLPSDWPHVTALDRHVSLMWKPRSEDIVFRVEAKTRGYIAIGLSKTGHMIGADIVVGWVSDEDGKPYVQDRYATARVEPLIDKSQDYHLLGGFQNDTHTVLTFKRSYNTCDKRDFRITNDTVRLLFAYHPEDPKSGTSSISYHGHMQRGSRSIYLLERSDQKRHLPFDVKFLDLRSPNIILPEDEDTLYWCKVFQLPNLREKHHIIRYEPIFHAHSNEFMHHVLVYECYSADEEFEKLAKEDGHQCYQPSMPPMIKYCNNLIVAWAIGSQGLTLPDNVGYPMDPVNGAKFVMMEVHYDNPNRTSGVRDSSGMRLYYTNQLREVDAGVLSVGIDPHWRHMIPPRQKAVSSYGHCIGECLYQVLDSNGINVFAIVLHSHLLGRKIRLRHFRNSTELRPIAADNNYDFNYQEFRTLALPVKILPGDHLITECVYNSKGRNKLTVGGLSTREEMCLAFAYYYPRVDLSLCHSLPSTSTLLASMGIEEIWENHSSFRIKKPKEFANHTLREYLEGFDWSANFPRFQAVIQKNSFSPLCWKKGQSLLPETVESTFNFKPSLSAKSSKHDHLCSHLKNHNTFVEHQHTKHMTAKNVNDVNRKKDGNSGYYASGSLQVSANGCTWLYLIDTIIVLYIKCLIVKIA